MVDTGDFCIYIEVLFCILISTRMKGGNNCMQVLELQDVTYSIRDRLLIDIDHLQLQAGQVVGLIGKNGQGNTTLLRLIKGEILPDSGTVKVEGIPYLMPQLKQDQTQGASGGEITSEFFLQATRDRAKILLLDEPTTNLDTSHRQWVERKLKRVDAGVILVSHDRHLLDEICSEIWVLDEGNVTVYSGNYSDYITERDRKRRHQQKEYEKYQKKKQQLEKAAEMKRRQAERATVVPKSVSDPDRRQIGATIYYAGKQKKLHKNRQAIETQIKQLEPVEKPKQLSTIEMEVPNQQRLRERTIIRFHELAGGVEHKTLWKPSTLQLIGGQKIGLIGDNGAGKTTLLRMLLSSKHPDIQVNPQVKFGYFAQNLSVLKTEETVLVNVMETSVQSETICRVVLARMGFYEQDIRKLVSVLSGGERVKVALAKILVGDFNVLVLDEPTNYLDIYAVAALEELLIEYPGTIILASHDQSIVEDVCDQLLVIDQNTLQLFKGTLSEFQAYDPQTKRDHQHDRLLQLNNRISEILGRLSLYPDDEQLQEQFDQLMAEKKEIEALE